MPLIAPMRTSVITRSGEITSSSATAFSADSAVTTPWPSAVSSSDSTFRMAGSSSTIMMVDSSAGARRIASMAARASRDGGARPTRRRRALTRPR
jgi:hypothetical protein